MEDNIAKLLQIVGGVLVGVMLLSLVSFFFSSIGLWPQTQDDIKGAEQLATFNLEYEVYDKKAMYGVDVISCLNKAKSNNEKYADGGSFLINNKYGSNFYIDVYVRLTKKQFLEESLEVYYFEKGTGVQRQFFDNQELSDTHEHKYHVMLDGTTPLTMEQAGFYSPNEKTDHYYTTLGKDFKIRNDTFKIEKASDLKCNPRPDKVIEKDKGSYSHNDFEGNPINGYYTLRDVDGNDKNVLSSLLSLSNKSDSGNLTKVVVNSTGKNLDRWSRIVWKTALYDLKSRKFKCDFIGYSDKTGRVNEICFSEI